MASSSRSSALASVSAPASRSWACASRCCSADRASHSPGASRSCVSSSISHCNRSMRMASSREPLRAASSALDACCQRCQPWARSASSRSCPASRSSSSRWAPGRSRCCDSCWPWMSTSCSPSSRSRAMVLGWPLICARERPSFSTMRRSSSWPGSPARSCSASQAANVSSMPKSAEMSARSAPSRTSVASPRPPSTRPMASSRMDLPAPVSPVSTVKPGPNSISADSTITKSLSRNHCSMMESLSSWKALRMNFV